MQIHLVYGCSCKYAIHICTYIMFGVHLHNIIDHYKITNMQRSKLRELNKRNEDIGDLNDQYKKIELRIKTCTAMDNEKLYDEIMSLIKMFTLLIKKYVEEDKIQYTAIIQQGDMPQHYLDFMLKNTQHVIDILTMRNTIMNDILCVK